MTVIPDKYAAVWQKITDAGIRMAFSPNAAGIAQGWALRYKERVEFSTKLPTWGVNGDGIWVNPEFTAGLSTGQTVFVIGHEFLHIALDHFGLARSLGLLNENGTVVEGREQDFEEHFRTAADAIDNEILIRDRIGDPIPDIIRLPDGYDGELSTAALFYWLKQKADEQKQDEPDEPKGGDEGEPGEPGDDQQPGDQPGEGPPTPQPPQGETRKPGQGCVPRGYPGKSQTPGQPQTSPEAEIEEVRTILGKAAGQGSCLAQAMAPVPRRATLRDLLEEGASVASQDASSRTRAVYTRASRRDSIDPDIMKPGYEGDEPSLCVVMDVSGSVAREFVEMGASLCQSISETFPNLRVYLVTHTDRVCWSGWIREGGDPATIAEATGHSGGTNAEPAYRDALEANHGVPFDTLVHVTDCEIGEWPEVPAHRLIVGVCGAPSLALDAGSLSSMPPEGAVLIPIQEGD